MKPPIANHPDIPLEQLQEMMLANGVKRLLLKHLAPNDNSKNQPYVSKNELSAFNILPAGDFNSSVSDKGNKILKASFPLEWLRADGSTSPAPQAKLIYYPQYPEVRMSGFLMGSPGAPNSLMNTREEGRLLFLGITDDRRVIGWAAGPESVLAQQVAALAALETEGVFKLLPIDGTTIEDSLEKLTKELIRIHRLQWIASKKMAGGIVIPYNAPNAVGYTLEAELGISNNGLAEPDFEGWEVKAQTARSYLRVPPSKTSSLFTPSPDGGIYQTMSSADFIRRYGYPDTKGVPDRLNFGGQFRMGVRQPRTGLTMEIFGFDVTSGKMTDVTGRVALLDDHGVEAMSWSFAKLLNRWNKKHAKAVYVPGEMRAVPDRSYRYGPSVLLCEGTDFELFLKSLATGKIVYDPGLKLLNASTTTAGPKVRGPFRIKWKDISGLYNGTRMEKII